MKLNLGCRNRPFPGYINVDIDPNNPHADVCDDAFILKTVRDGTCDVIEAIHMFEHLDYVDGIKALRLWHSKLKDGGILRLSVPDLKKASSLFLLTDDHELVRTAFSGSQKDQWDYHKAVYSRDALESALIAATFKNIKDWNYWEVWPHSYIDTYAGAVWPHMMKKYKFFDGEVLDLGGVQLSLNIQAMK